MQNNILFEMLPLVIFFAVYYFTKNIFLATSVLIVASWIQLVACKVFYKRISRNMWISTLLITIFGGLTVYLQNKTFVMLKPSILFWIVGGSLLIGQALGKNGIKVMLSKEIELSNSIWNKINAAWGLFFIAMGFLNLYVALNYSEYFWVKFKVFGSTSITVIFMILTVVFVAIAKKKKTN
jgi:intracellular septation protein